jgi:hypothetical protein
VGVRSSNLLGSTTSARKRGVEPQFPLSDRFPFPGLSSLSVGCRFWFIPDPIFSSVFRITVPLLYRLSGFCSPGRFFDSCF